MLYPLAGIAGMSGTLMRATTDQDREEAMAKLYVMMQQRMMWSKRLPHGGADSLAEILDINIPEFLKYLANIILRKDKQSSEQVSPCQLPWGFEGVHIQ